jgi:NAD(P)-dependent dehydrogenase (short-subunit alcohol dehydrogenase family)
MSTILITGSNRGIGLELAERYASIGWDVIATCRTPEKADKLHILSKQYRNLSIEMLEITDELSIKALTIKLKDKAIDILINNAGIYSARTNGNKPYSGDNKDPGQKFGSLDADGWAFVLKVNAVAPFMVTEALLPNILSGAHRKVIMITSRGGSIETVQEGGLAYRSSKAALNSAMRSTSRTLTPKGITMISLHPGWVQTDMGGMKAQISVEASVNGMVNVITELKLDDSGKFFDYEGKSVPW